MAGKGEGKQGRDQPPRLPRRRGDQRRRARRRRGRAAPDRRRGRARRRPRRAPAAADAPARLLPADRHRPDRRAGPRHREDLQDRRQAGRGRRRPPLLARRPGRARSRTSSTRASATTASSSAPGRAASRRRSSTRTASGRTRRSCCSIRCPTSAATRTATSSTCPNAAAGGADLTILRNGGTVNLDSIGAWDQPAGSLLDIPGSYGQPALDMLDFCGVDVDNFPSSTAPGIPASYGLRQMLLFPAADWGTDTLAQNRNNATEPEHARGLDRVRQPAAVLAGGQGRDRADPDRHDDRLARPPSTGR